MSGLTHIEEDTVESQVEKLIEAIQHLQERVEKMELQAVLSTP
jgi:hypothetical protein